MEEMWTKKELMHYARRCAMDYSWNDVAKRLNYCQAWYVEDGDIALLKSYNTIVAVYNRKVGTLYVFDYYSATTTQHVWKFARRIGAARITWLYRRHDGVIETALAEHVNTYKLSTASAQKLEHNDYRGYITSKWGF